MLLPVTSEAAGDAANSTAAATSSGRPTRPIGMRESTRSAKPGLAMRSATIGVSITVGANGRGNVVDLGGTARGEPHLGPRACQREGAGAADAAAGAGDEGGATRQAEGGLGCHGESPGDAWQLIPKRCCMSTLIVYS